MILNKLSESINKEILRLKLHEFPYSCPVAEVVKDFDDQLAIRISNGPGYETLKEPENFLIELKKAKYISPESFWELIDKYNKHPLTLESYELSENDLTGNF